MNPQFAQAVHHAITRDARYSPEAYELVRRALSYASEVFRHDQEDQHVSGQELLEGFLHYVLREFGPMSLTILDQWGLHRGEDVGNIVYNLIEVGYFGRTDGDSIEDFAGGYDFQSAFIRPFLPENKDRSLSQLPSSDLS